MFSYLALLCVGGPATAYPWPSLSPRADSASNSGELDQWVAVGLDACEGVGGEEARVLTAGKVHICFILCRIQLIISTITMIIRDLIFLFT